MAEPPRISTLIQEMLRDLELTQDQAAAQLGVSRYSVNQLCNDRRTITAPMAIKLEALARKHANAAVSIRGRWRADWWLQRQMEIDLWDARRAANG